MNINIEPNLQTSTSSFFSALDVPAVIINKLKVPIYQREYDWDEDEIVRLLSDLDNYITADDFKIEIKESYFTGAVILEKLKSNIDNCFEVVDGQQRLTTLYLLNFLAYVITSYRYQNVDLTSFSPRALIRHQKRLEDQIIEESKKLSFGDFNNLVFDNDTDEIDDEVKYRISAEYLVNDKDLNLRFEISDSDNNNNLKTAILNTNIVENNKQLKLLIPNNNRYGENLETIFIHLYSSLSEVNLNNDQILDKMKERIDLYLNHSGVALIISENKDDSFKLFEVLNDTARKLTVLDLLKNYFVEHLGDKYSNDKWKELKGYEKRLKSGINLINDLIKSEGFTKTTKEYTYLSNQNKNRHPFFKNETVENYFDRLLNVTINLNAITQRELFNKELSINSLHWNLAAIHSLKFHWGRQTMLAVFNLNRLLGRDKKIIESIVWNNVEHSRINSYQVQEKLYLIISDLLIKIGIISKVNNLSSKQLPEIAQKILNKYISLISSPDFKHEQNMLDYIEDVKGLSATYFDAQKNNFSTNLKSLTYTNNSHKSIFKHLLFFLYNRGENSQYHVDKMSLEHIEPQNGQGYGYFKHEERDSIVNGFGNMVLIGQSKNSKFSNSTVEKKIEMANSDDFIKDAFISHKLFISLDPEQKPNSGAYGEFDLLLDDTNYSEKFVPSECFFSNRMKFYEINLIEMIFNNKKFLITGLPY